MHCLDRTFLNLLLKGKHAFLRLPNSKDLLESRLKNRKYFLIVMEIYLFKTLGGICFKNLLVSINMIFKFKAKSLCLCLCLSVCYKSHCFLLLALGRGTMNIERHISFSNSISKMA